MATRLDRTPEGIGGGEAIAPPVLGQYTDFRQYLRSFYEYKKKTLSTAVRPYSYAAFSAAADIKSPN
ncbi:MAG: TIGR02147 family protein, partial [Bdellovibrionales bacterium]|nr:TIGR02147 family protein [Bdellovibrionales bacterium]